MNILNRQFKTIFGAGIVLASFNLLSKIFGLLRDRILAGSFGAGDTLDIYYTAFKIPDLVFNLIVIGAVSAAFIPVFIEKYEDNESNAWKLVSNFLNFSLLVVAALSLILLIFTPQLMEYVAPGFDLEKKKAAIALTRLMFLSPVIFTVSTIVGSALQSLQKFLSYAVAPIFYNVGIIIGALVFAPRMETSYMGLGWGVILGAFLHLMVQFPTLIKSGFNWRLHLNLGDKALRKIVKLMVPRTIGLATLQINFIVINAIASTLAVGSITIFNFANHLQHLPIGFFGASLATAVFPTLSRRALTNREQFKKNVGSAIRNVTLMVLPVSILMYFLRFWIVNIVLGVGNFGVGDIFLTAEVLGIFSFSVLAYSLVLVLSKVYFAVQDTKTPVILSVISIAVNIYLSFHFSYLGVLGLAMAFSLAGNLNALLLLIGLRKISS